MLETWKDEMTRPNDALQYRNGQLINFKPERFEKISDDGIMIMRAP
jgi:hypothetical protein